MSQLSDGRRLRVRRNGMSHVSIEGSDGQQYTFDHQKATQLARALRAGTPCRIGTNSGRVLAYNGGIVLGDASHHDAASAGQWPQARSQRPSGPWYLDEHGIDALVRQLLAAVSA